MPSERVQRHIDALLDETDTALRERAWDIVRERTQAVLALDPANADAQELLAAAERMLVTGDHALETLAVGTTETFPTTTPPPATSFANGRYQVARLLGEGGKKRVFLAHDTLLDRDVAFALIKTEGLDDAGRQRIRREAQAMGRLGDHAHIVTVFDIGDEQHQPFLVSQLMTGGDLATRLTEAPEHRLPIDAAVTIALQVCQALEHAHGQRVIHRDLKPGNIWLSQDGTAKLGDFGLAVALDQTRHTQPSMMVGTVSYMAPEQAIGGVVDARADLYALGCVLYELVCGRPPFIGEESVAIITQHLNSPPVHPTWHRPDCPPGLEALILRLLEKDPAQRPPSATEVSLALLQLQSPTPPGSLPPWDGGTEGGRTELAPGQSPLYQQTFVGREPELRQLQSAYDAALSGQGGLVMVVGEPGIGKTTLCEQLATYATVRGGATLVGHCYEEGSLSLPYLAFVEALRSYVLSREPETLKEALGSGAGDVARIVSEVRERVAIEPRAPGGDPEEDRWRLLEAVTGFLRNASSVQPLVLVLEDLHWADRGTLDLLQHVARNLTGARLLIVGTYRDVEVDRSHPLSSALADLRRSSAFVRIGLRGLSVDEVHRMMQQLRGQDVPWSRAEAIHRQTEGNPLFVQEVLRYLVEEGLVVREGGRWVRADDGSPESGIPEGLRDVIGKRLSRLSEATNRVLAIAAVIGREFRLDVLQSVSQIPAEELEPALDEATRMAVLQEEARPGAIHYRFAHAFFRQTLYEELSAPRRLRLHQQVARALETLYGNRLSEHAAELAEHFAQSTDPADLAKAVHYSEVAAERARAVYAYGEAARHLEQALEVQEVLDPDDRSKRCELLLALGEVLLPQGEPLRLIDVAIEEAYALAEGLSDSSRACRAAVTACEALKRVLVGRGGGIDTPTLEERYASWASRARQHALTGTVDSVYAEVYSGSSLMQRGQPGPAHEHWRRAIHVALEQGEHASFFAAAQFVPAMRALRDRGLRQRVAEEFMMRPHTGIRSADMITGLHQIGKDFLECGLRERAEACWYEAELLAQRTVDASLLNRMVRAREVLLYLDGRLDEALALDQSFVHQARELGVAADPAPQALLMHHLGLDTSPFLPELQRPIRTYQAQKAVLLAWLGRNDEARAMLQMFSGLADEADETGETILAMLLHVATLTKDTETLGGLVPRLASSGGRLAEGFTTGGISWSHGRLLGSASVLLGKPDEALGFYQQGLEVCERVRFRPELALLHLDLAELLLDHSPDKRTEALEHLDFAIGELRDMKMRPMLERALRRKLRLQGVDSVSPSTSIDAVAIAVEAERPNLKPHAAPDGTVTLLFTDIEDSTGHTVRLGDQRWLEILRAHHALIRRQVHDHGGFEVKSQGDGFMLAFGSARRALDCAVAIQCAVEAGNASHPDAPIRVRIGLHTGEALKEADDFHGKHVVLAARIANQARGGEILVSALLKELTESSGDLRFDDGREVELKGLDGLQRVHRVMWA